MNPISSPSRYKEPKGVPWAEIGIGLIFVALLLLVRSPGCGRKRTQPPSVNALSNIKQTDLAIIMFENDFNDSAPEMVNFPVFQDMLMPYLRNPSICFDPDTGKAFIPNPKLSHMDSSRLTSPSLIVMLYDADTVNGRRIVAYADGHAKSIEESEFKKEIAIDPHAPHGLGFYDGNWQTASGKITIDEKGPATMRQLNGKVVKGKAGIDQKDHLTISFGTKAPTIEGDVTWLSINQISLKKKTGGMMLNRLP